MCLCPFEEYCLGLAVDGIVHPVAKAEALELGHEESLRGLNHVALIGQSSRVGRHTSIAATRLIVLPVACVGQPPLVQSPSPAVTDNNILVHVFLGTLGHPVGKPIP